MALLGLGERSRAGRFRIDGPRHVHRRHGTRSVIASARSSPVLCLVDAGFADVEVLPIEHEFWRFYRLHPPAAAGAETR